MGKIAQHIIGIDAAWTERGSSGVALLELSNAGSRVLAIAPSYSQFIGLSFGEPLDWKHPPGNPPDVPAIMAAAQRIAGAQVSLVAIDMPLAVTPIHGRRVADNAVSRAYGAVGAAVHSPSAERPGRLGQIMFDGFAGLGFSLATVTRPLAPLSLVEVFPLAALVELLRASKRPPYKAAKARSYWPTSAPNERLEKLHLSWQTIHAALCVEVSGLANFLPLPSWIKVLAHMKPYEDALDAIICAWVGACVLRGYAKPFGDSEAAIWIPQRDLLPTKTPAM